MKFGLFFSIAVLGFAQMASANITLQLSTTTPTVVAGNQAIFALHLVSDVVAGESINGVEANVNAGLGDGLSGVFVAPSAHTGILGISPVDLTTTLGQLFASNTLASGTLNVPSGLGIKWLDIFLDTTNLDGNYTLTLDQIAVTTDVGPTFTTPFSGSSVNFNVTAVPEPSSMLTVAIGFGVLMYRRRRASMALAT